MAQIHLAGLAALVEKKLWRPGPRCWLLPKLAPHLGSAADPQLAAAELENSGWLTGGQLADAELAQALEVAAAPERRIQIDTLMLGKIPGTMVVELAFDYASAVRVDGDLVSISPCLSREEIVAGLVTCVTDDVGVEIGPAFALAGIERLLLSVAGLAALKGGLDATFLCTVMRELGSECSNEDAQGAIAALCDSGWVQRRGKKYHVATHRSTQVRALCAAVQTEITLWDLANDNEWLGLRNWFRRLNRHVWRLDDCADDAPLTGFAPALNLHLAVATQFVPQSAQDLEGFFAALIQAERQDASPV